MPGGELSSYISHSMPGTRFQMRARHTLLPTQETVWYFLETTGHFLLLGLAGCFTFHKLHLQPPGPIICSGDSWAQLSPVATVPLASGCPSRKGTNKYQWLFSLPSQLSTLIQGIIFHLDAYCEFFFQCQSHIRSYPALTIIFHWLQLKPVNSTHGTILFAITHAVSTRNSD